MRDWFFFVIWSVRLKKILKHQQSSPDDRHWLSQLLLPDRFLDLFKSCTSKDVSYDRLFKTQEKEHNKSLKSHFTMQMQLKIKEVNLQIQKDYLFEDAASKFVLEVYNLAFSLKASNLHGQTIHASIGNFELS